MAGNGGVIGPTNTVSAPRPALTTKVTASGCFSPRAATPATVLVVAGGAGGGRQGAGGGGAGGTGTPGSVATTSTAGTANTGGGGGGGGYNTGGAGAAGGSGIIIVRAPSDTTFAVSPGTNSTSTHPGGDKLATFTVSGTLTVS